MAEVLYRFFGMDGALLYVGITVDPPGTRFRNHQREKPWGEVVRIELEHHPDRTSVESAEREAIRMENPLWNVAFKPKPAPRALPQLTLTVRGRIPFPSWKERSCVQVDGTPDVVAAWLRALADRLDPPKRPTR